MTIIVHKLISKIQHKGLTMLKGVLIVILLILAWYGNRQYQHKKFLQEVQTQIQLEEKVQAKSAVTPTVIVTQVQSQQTSRVPKKITPKFHCDGRQHCSQMRSYEEAKFFLNHCPNTKMDGDRDGVPCERQFNRYD